jgi:hypothetical protein
MVGSIPGPELPVHSVATELVGLQALSLGIGDVVGQIGKRVPVYEHNVGLGEVYAVEHPAEILVRRATHPVFADVPLRIRLVRVHAEVRRHVTHDVVGPAPEMALHAGLRQHVHSLPGVFRQPVAVHRLVYPRLELIVQSVVAPHVGIRAGYTDVFLEVEVLNVQRGVHRLYRYA